MILIGACRQPGRKEAALAVVEADLVRGKKRYAVFEIDGRLDPDPSAFVQQLRGRIEDESLLRKKRLFSQDRRPQKTLTDRPRLVAAEDGAGIAEMLRQCGVVCEAVFFSPVIRWQKELVGKALGANYTVDPKAVLAEAAAVVKEGRIHFEGTGSEVGTVLSEIEALAEASAAPQEVRTDSVPASLLALCTLLWFREAVPYRRTYRAN